jgi:hypothetical protein
MQSRLQSGPAIKPSSVTFIETISFRMAFCFIAEMNTGSLSTFSFPHALYAG